MGDTLSGTALGRVLASAAEVAGLLWEKGWAERNAGNLSCDVTEMVPSGVRAAAGGPTTPLPRALAGLGGRWLLVTAAGSRMREVAKAPDRCCGLLALDAEGSGYSAVWQGQDAGPFVPTSELPSHLAIHAALRRRRAPPPAIVHAHPTELVALSHDRRVLDEDGLNRLLAAMHPETVVVVPRGLALVPYVLPGSEEQGLAAGSPMETHDVALWEKHGAVAVGATFGEAFDLLDAANKAARLLLLCRAAGYEPEGLTGAQLDDLRRAYGGGPGA